MPNVPAATPRFSETVVEQLDEAIAWLEDARCSVLEHETGNPRTIGKRFDTRRLTETLASRGGRCPLGHVQASDTGTWPDGTAARSGDGRVPRAAGSRARACPSAANPWSEGDGLDLALARGGETAGAREEFYGRAMPAGIPIEEAEFVPLSQLYGRFAEVVSRGRGPALRRARSAWSETNLVQTIAHWPGGRAWYRVHEAASASASASAPSPT